jgi:bleomycin hydrolase
VLSLDKIKKCVIRSLKAGIPVWFDCDVGKCFNYDKSLLHDKAYDYGKAMGVKYGMSKADELSHRLTEPSHAMLIVGVNTEEGKPTRWRVENSWGYDREYEPDPGHLLMTDTWLDKYAFDFVVDREFIAPTDLEEISKYREEPINLDFYDPFGAVARKPCKSCILKCRKDSFRKLNS